MPCSPPDLLHAECNRCHHPAHEVTHQYLERVRETWWGRHAEAVYFCARTCELAWLSVNGHDVPRDRRDIEALG